MQDYSSRPATMVKPGSVIKSSVAGRPTVGAMFDSGCNTSGVAKVHVEFGTPEPLFSGRRDSIMRIHLEFRKPFDSKSPREPTYLALQNPSYPHPTKIRTCTFEVEPWDKIIKVLVWTDNISDALKAVQFYTKTGMISQIYGIPQARSNCAEFVGEDEASQLAGVHGTFDESFVCSLGFTFASVVVVSAVSDHMKLRAAKAEDGGKEEEADFCHDDQDYIVVVPVGLERKSRAKILLKADDDDGKEDDGEEGDEGTVLAPLKIMLGKNQSLAYLESPNGKKRRMLPSGSSHPSPSLGARPGQVA